jgi:hypothetical protein
MIHETEILTEVETFLTEHWRYVVLPRERRAIRAVQRLEAQLSPVESGAVSRVDIVNICLACVLLMAVGWRLA